MWYIALVGQIAHGKGYSPMKRTKQFGYGRARVHHRKRVHFVIVIYVFPTHNVCEQHVHYGEIAKLPHRVCFVVDGKRVSFDDACTYHSRMVECERINREQKRVDYVEFTYKGVYKRTR